MKLHMNMRLRRGAKLHLDRVLVVEDNDDYQLLISRALENRGVLVSVASDAASALDQCVRNDYGLVLVDLFLPTMTGTELAVQIRRLRSNTRIAVMSAARIEFIIEQVSGFAFDAVFSKPLVERDYFQIIELLRSVLKCQK